MSKWAGCAPIKCYLQNQAASQIWPPDLVWGRKEDGGWYRFSWTRTGVVYISSTDSTSQNLVTCPYLTRGLAMSPLKKKKRKPGLMNTSTHFHFPVEKRPSVKELAVNKLLKMADKHLGMFVFGKLYTDAKGITLQIVGLTTQQISRYRWCSTASDL